MSDEAGRDDVVSACLIIIGNEILSGRTQDTNLAHLSQVLNELGVQMREARVIPDVESVIVDTVNTCRASSITCSQLGVLVRPMMTLQPTALPWPLGWRLSFIPILWRLSNSEKHLLK